MSYVYAALAIVVGFILTAYSVSTISDPFWSRRTSLVGWLGAVVGSGAIFVGFAAIAVMLVSRLVCSVCSGFHHPEVCPTAQRFLAECRQPVVGEPGRPGFSMATIVDLTEYTYRRQHETDLARRKA